MINRLTQPQVKKAPLSQPGATPLLSWIVLLAGLAAGAVVGYLLVADEWQIALALIFLLPGLIIIHKNPFLAVIIWLFLGPFLLHTNTSAERQIYWIIHRAMPPMTIGIIWLSSALGIQQRRFPKLGVSELMMVGYLAFGFLSILLQNGTPRATLYHFYDRVFSPMCLYLIIRLTVPGEKAWRWLMLVLFFIVVSQSVVGVLSWVAPSVLPSKWLDKVGERTTGTLVNPSIYTTALIFAGFLMLHGALQQKRGMIRNILVAVFLLCLFGIFISFSRASWLAGILVVAGLVYIYPKFMARFTLIAVIVTLLLGTFLLPPYINKARDRLYSDAAQGSALDRLPGFLAAYRMFQEKPFFGWGYGNFDVYDRQFMGRVMDFANDNKDHASHNWYLSMLAEQGLVGMLLFFGPIGWWFYMSVKKWPHLPKRGVWNKKLLILLWLIIFSEVVINNFMNMIIFFGHGLWWIIPALIANLLARQRFVDKENALQQQVTAVWKTAPLHPF